MKVTETEYFKLEIFIPKTHLSDLQKALRETDAGHIGKYDSCLSYSKVIGVWRPLEGTSPYSGKEGALSEEEELKVEVTVKRDNLMETVATEDNSVRRLHFQLENRYG